MEEKIRKDEKDWKKAAHAKPILRNPPEGHGTAFYR